MEREHNSCVTLTCVNALYYWVRLCHNTRYCKGAIVSHSNVLLTVDVTQQ